MIAGTISFQRNEYVQRRLDEAVRLVRQAMLHFLNGYRRDLPEEMLGAAAAEPGAVAADDVRDMVRDLGVIGNWEQRRASPAGRALLPAAAHALGVLVREVHTPRADGDPAGDAGGRVGRTVGVPGGRVVNLYYDVATGHYDGAVPVAEYLEQAGKLLGGAHRPPAEQAAGMLRMLEQVTRMLDEDGEVPNGGRPWTPEGGLRWLRNEAPLYGLELSARERTAWQQLGRLLHLASQVRGDAEIPVWALMEFWKFAETVRRDRGPGAPLDVAIGELQDAHRSQASLPPAPNVTAAEELRRWFQQLATGPPPYLIQGAHTPQLMRFWGRARKLGLEDTGDRDLERVFRTVGRVARQLEFSREVPRSARRWTDAEVFRAVGETVGHSPRGAGEVAVRLARLNVFKFLGSTEYLLPGHEPIPLLDLQDISEVVQVMLAAGWPSFNAMLGKLLGRDAPAQAVGEQVMGLVRLARQVRPGSVESCEGPIWRRRPLGGGTTLSCRRLTLRVSPPGQLLPRHRRPRLSRRPGRRPGGAAAGGCPARCQAWVRPGAGGAGV